MRVSGPLTTHCIAGGAAAPGPELPCVLGERRDRGERGAGACSCWSPSCPRTTSPRARLSAPQTGTNGRGAPPSRAGACALPPAGKRPGPRAHGVGSCVCVRPYRCRLLRLLAPQRATAARFNTSQDLSVPAVHSGAPPPPHGCCKPLLELLCTLLPLGAGGHFHASATRQRQYQASTHHSPPAPNSERFCYSRRCRDPFPAGRSSVSLFAASAVIYRPSGLLTIPWEPRQPKLTGKCPLPCLQHFRRGSSGLPCCMAAPPPLYCMNCRAEAVFNGRAVTVQLLLPASRDISQCGAREREAALPCTAAGIAGTRLHRCAGPLDRKSVV